MRNLKNAHYKSSEQFYGATNTEVLAANTVTNPVVLNPLRNVTETGVAIEDGTILATGTYRASADVTLEGTTAGVITIAITNNGTTLPETVRSATVGVGETVSIHTETVRYFETCCNINHELDLIIYSDGTAVSDITMISGNIIKLA
jgi:hypothetical protein